MRPAQTPSCRASGGYAGRPSFATHLTAMLAAAGLLCGLLPGQGAPTVIGPETSVSLPPSANWNEIVNICPGSNETVTLNPPLFSWFYAPGNPLNQAVDQNVYFFQFQADYTGTFANPVVNVSTPSCCYNFLAPFTNSPVYWRVAYLTTSGTTNSWITNSFNIAANATNWDRSMLANPSYLAGKSVHPHLLFNSANKAAVSQFVQTNNPALWQGVTNLAAQGMASSYWTTPAPWPQNPNLFSGPGVENAALEISSAAFAWQMTGDPKWTNGLATNFDNMVNCFVSSGYLGALGFNTDYGNSGGDNYWVTSIAYAYDWLYPILTPSERTNAQAALDRVIRLNLYNEFWLTCMNKNISVFPRGNFDTNSVYPPPYYVPYAQASKLGTGHGWFTTAASWIVTLACFGDGYRNSAWPVYPTNYSSDAVLFLDLGLNYMIGRGTPHGFGCVADSRSYGFEDTINNTLLFDMMNAAIVFPEANLNTHPGWTAQANWWMWMIPAGYESVHEQWGDVKSVGSSELRLATSGRDLALFTGSPAVSQYYQSLNQIYGLDGHNVYYNEIVPPFYFHMAAPLANPTLAACSPTDGWVWGSAYPPSTPSCFGNGVGFVFAARPRGENGGVGHAEFNDLNIEIYAYGANVTDGVGGSDNASKESWSYNTVQINGLGQAQSQEGPTAPAVASILAFTNAPDYVYCAGDATYAYPHTPFPFAGDPGGWLMPQQYVSLLANGPLSCVTKVQRHVLFEHHQYFVIFDDLATTTNSNFEWVYHVHQNTVTNLTQGGSFNYSVSPADVSALRNPYPWTNVNVCVYQVVNPMLLNAVNMSGTNAYANPVTGENYYADAMNDLTNGTANPLLTNSIWVTNLVATNRFHFMTVIYPVPPGGTAPSFTRLDDYTVAVTNGAQGDVISFNPQTTNLGLVTLLVNSPFLTSPATPLPPPPPPLFTNSFSSEAPNLPPAPAVAAFPPPASLRIIGTLVPSTFTPVSGYTAWWNTDTLTGANGSPVSSWVDSSAKGFKASQSTPANQPALELQLQNGRNCLWFNGSSDFLAANALGTLNQPVEMFCVVQPMNLSFNGMALGNATGPAVGLGVFNNSYYLAAGDGLIGGAETNSWLEITAILNDASSQVWVNGVQVISPGARAGGNNMTGVNLGAMFNQGETYFWLGYMGDVVIYNSILSDANRRAVEAGLRAKYGF